MAPRSFLSLNVDDGQDGANAVRNCSTIAELHAVLPLSFRPALAAYLTKVYRIATKAGTVGNTIAQYETHQRNGTFPPFIANTIKVPRIQFSNEYDGTPEGRSSDKDLAEVVKKARVSFLAEALKRKKQEQTILLNLLVFKESEWQAEVETTAGRVAASLGATFTRDPDNPSARWAWSGAPVPDSIQTEAQGLWLLGNIYHTKAIAIARAVADKALLQRVKNMTLKEKAESDKMDVDSKDLSVQNTIEEALKKFKHELQSGAITVKNKTTGPPKGGRKGGNSNGGRNKGKVNKPQPKKGNKQRRN